MKVEFWEFYGKYYDYLYGNDSDKAQKIQIENMLEYEEKYKNDEVFRMFCVTMMQIRQDTFDSDRELACCMLAYKDTLKAINKRFNETVGGD